jgi:hypothetical protein
MLSPGSTRRLIRLVRTGLNHFTPRQIERLTREFQSASRAVITTVFIASGSETPDRPGDIAVAKAVNRNAPWVVDMCPTSSLDPQQRTIGNTFPSANPPGQSPAGYSLGWTRVKTCKTYEDCGRESSCCRSRRRGQVSLCRYRPPHRSSSSERWGPRMDYRSRSFEAGNRTCDPLGAEGRPDNLNATCFERAPMACMRSERGRRGLPVGQSLRSDLRRRGGA